MISLDSHMYVSSRFIIQSILRLGFSPALFDFSTVTIAGGGELWSS